MLLVDSCHTAALQGQVTTCLLHAVQLKSPPKKLKQRNVIEILQDSLQDKPSRSLHGDQETYDEVRYKLVIDPSEDDSLSRLLLMYKILDPKKTRTFMCSDFPEDSHLQKVGQEPDAYASLYRVMCSGRFLFLLRYIVNHYALNIIVLQ